jgi:ankyrin repeat protein
MIQRLITLLLVLLTSCGMNDEKVKALIEAAGDGNVHEMSLLIDRGANVNGVALDGWTPLTQAAAAGQLDAVRVLLAHGADINRAGNTVTPLHYAIFKGNLEVARFLVQNGARLKLDPVVEKSFLDRVRSYKNDELMNLVAQVMSRENN